MSWETFWPRESVALSLGVRITSGLMGLVPKTASNGHWHSNSWYSNRHESTLVVWLMRVDKWQYAGGRNGPLRVGISTPLVGADIVPDLVGDGGSRIGKGTPGISDLRSCLFVCFWRDSPQWTVASSFTSFLDHTQRRTTVGRTPLDESSARRRDLFLTKHNNHDRHPCPRWDSNPQSQQASGRRPTS